MFSQHPKLAKEFASKTPSIKSLPQHVKKPQVKGRRIFSDRHPKS